MTTIYTTTSDQLLVASVLPALARNNVETVRLFVEFDSAWDGYPARSAVFTTSLSSKPYEVIISSGFCLVPQEVLAEPCRLYITVKGVSSAGAVKSSTRLTLKVSEGAPSVVLSDPTPTVYQQLLNENAVLKARLSAQEAAGTVEGSEVIGIRTGADGKVYPTAGDAVREQIESTYRFPFIVLHGTTLVDFDLTANTVRVPTFRAIGKEGSIDVENTTLPFATNNGINVVYFQDGATGICMTSGITKQMQPIFSFNAVSLQKFVGCSLPVANYSVNGKTFFEYKDANAKHYYANGFLATVEHPVAFDSVNKTVTIAGDFRLQGNKQLPANVTGVTLDWDMTGSATNYVYMNAEGALVCSSTAPTADDLYIFAFFKGKNYLEGRTGCTLPANLYTVDGQAFTEERVINLTADANKPIEITRNTRIYGNGHELNLGTVLNGTRADNLVTIAYTPVEGSHFYKTFVDRTEPLLIETSRSYYNVTVWAFNGNKYEAIRLTPYLTLAEVTANPNSFTYVDGRITINSADYIDFVLAGEEEYGIAVMNNATVEIHDLKVLFARANCVDINAGHVKLYNCEFGYSTTANGLSVQRADCAAYACKAYYNRNDGFNYHHGGHSTLIECEGYNNFDDGVSHHEDCTFEINGGTWERNGKGGVASPTYGARGRISNVLCRGNYYGIYADAEETVAEPVLLNGAVITGNTKAGIYANNYTFNVYNSTNTDD